MATPEGKIQREILVYLKEKGVFCWRNNNGAVFDQKLNSGYGGYRSNNIMKGVPDIIGIMPDGSGRFLGIEVKAPSGSQSGPQVLFERRTKRAGGVYILAKSVEDVDKVLKLDIE